MNEEYIKARKAGEREYKSKLSKGEYPYLPALDDICPECGTLPKRTLGLTEIPTELIVGTKTRARQNSFAADFMPLLEPETEFGSKWSSLYQVQMNEGISDPIRVYEYLHRFYVQEGNKRVSVSLFLGMPTIMADVTRIMPSRETLKQHPVYEEFLDFYRVTGLYDIVCTIPGSYREIGELLGRSVDKDSEPWPEDLVKAIKTTYWRFSGTVRALQEKMPEMPLGDAFLVYLRIFVRDALQHQTDKELDKRLRLIRKELLTAYNRENVALVESADDAIKAGSLITKTSSLITKPGSIASKVMPHILFSEKNPLRAAFIYDKSPEQSDWIYNHEIGRLKVEQAYGGIVATRNYIVSPDPQHDGPHSAEEAFRAAHEWGADVAFTVTPRFMTDTLRAAIEYKDMHCLNCSVNLAHQAVRTYYAKLYEAKFLAGIVAAVEAGRCGSHMIGYCSDYPIYGTIACINAFAIGAAMIDPDIRICLEWTTKQDNDWWRSMQQKGINIISAFDSTHRIDGSNVYGVFRIDRDPESGAETVVNLAAPIWKWGKLYEIIIKTILEGTYHASFVDRKDQATNYWWGMISGVVDIELGEGLSPYTKQLVGILRSDIVDGTMNPFDGELKSQDGWIRRENDPPLTSKDIISMNWLNENIIGEIPEKDTLIQEAKETVSVSGVRKGES